MSLKQTARIISTYAGDTSGVASALFELGGMTVMHDASGCNSTYNTHDEPRWYDTDSLVFISALSETEAILGDDEKLVGDCVRAAEELNPRFVAVAGTPIPMMTGVDFDAVAMEIEARTGIPAFGFFTDGMHSYASGASMAFDALARRMVREPDGKKKPGALRVNLLGLTPLDFSVYGAPEAMKRVLGQCGIEVRSCWAMGSTLDDVADSASADVNLAVSSSGLAAARTLEDRFGIPWVAAAPCGERWNDRTADALREAARTGKSVLLPHLPPVRDTRRLVLGEGLTAASLASALALETGEPWSALSAVDSDPETDGALSDAGVPFAVDEDDIAPYLEGCEILIADPLYRPVCPENTRFVPLPHEGFSGRLFRKDIPDLTRDLSQFRKEQNL